MSAPFTEMAKAEGRPTGHGRESILSASLQGFYRVAPDTYVGFEALIPRKELHSSFSKNRLHQ